MSWQSELGEEIVFKSPSSRKAGGPGSGLLDKVKSTASSMADKYNPMGTGQSGTFTAKWRADKRSFERKIGQFDAPHAKGTIVQDLGPKSSLWPLTCYFDGMYHHRDARNFMKALFDERELWEVKHPVHGTLLLQLISAEEDSSPTEYGNYTIINMQWIEPATDEVVVSPEETLFSTLTKIMNVADGCMNALAQLRTDLFSAISFALGMFNKISGFLGKTLKELAATKAQVLDAFETARASFEGAKNVFDYDDPDTTDMSVALINMSRAPLDASTEYGERQTAYESYANELFTAAPKGTSADDRNAALALEFGATLALMAGAQIVVTTEYKTRPEVVMAIDRTTAFFNSVVRRLEAVQELYKDLTIDRQYFSQTQTYHDLIRLYTLVFQYLILQFYNLKIEKKIILRKDRNPLEIAITEYQPNPDEIDYYYSLLLESNDLHGNEIILCPAGKQLRIYV